MYKAKESYSMWGGDELRSRRSDMNMTQVALARALGISHRMYCYYELSLRYIHKNRGSDDEGTLAPQGTLTTFDRDRLSRLCLALDSHEGMDAETDKLLRQSLKEIDYLLSKFPE